MNCPACDTVNAEGVRFCAKCGALLPIASADTSDPLIGQVVGGRYRVVKMLGEGGMGRVYVAEQQMGTAVRNVAIKTLLQEFSRDPQVHSRFMRECATVVALEHANTIKFYDFGKTDGGDLYIAMELVNGKSLADVIQSVGRMPPDRVDHIMKQICGSLHEAHGKGVVHRDLKPENVILTERAGEDDFVKVLDFGIAKRSEAADSAREQKLTQAGMVLGTPPYMSPEQFTGKELDQRSDIYSLGVMAYEMLTGQLPFKANTPWEWATQHMTSQPFPFEQTTGQLAAHIPAGMKAAVLRALSKKREDRQETAKEFYRELSGGAATGPQSMLAPVSGVGPTESFALPGPMSAGAPQRAGATQMGEPMMGPPTGQGMATPMSGVPMTGPGMMGSGPMGSGPMGSGPMGPGPMGLGPMGSGPMGPGPMGPGPMGPGPMGPGPMGPPGSMMGPPGSMVGPPTMGSPGAAPGFTAPGFGPPGGGHPFATPGPHAIPAPPPMDRSGGGGGAKIALILGAALFVAAGVGGGVWWWQNRDSDDSSKKTTAATTSTPTATSEPSSTSDASATATATATTTSAATPSGSADTTASAAAPEASASASPSAEASAPTAEPSATAPPPSSGVGVQACRDVERQANSGDCTAAWKTLDNCPNGDDRNRATSAIAQHCGGGRSVGFGSGRGRRMPRR
jgi:serine/threonine-protein kinase